jgi:hypothetical protein
MNRLREADCPHTAFLEALGNPCLWLVLQRKSVSHNPTQPEFQITLEGNWQPLRPLQPRNRRPHSEDPSQSTIQYP